MSRSRRHNPAGGITVAESDAWAKRKANRIERHAVRIAIAADREVPAKRELTSVWSFPKDGHRWYGCGVDSSVLWK